MFAGSGTFRDASEPRGRADGPGRADRDAAPVYDADNQSLVLFDRGDESDGAGRTRGNPFPAGVRQAHRGAGRVVRPDRDEHAGTAPSGDARTAQTARLSSTLNRSKARAHRYWRAIWYIRMRDCWLPSRRARSSLARPPGSSSEPPNQRRTVEAHPDLRYQAGRAPALRGIIREAGVMMPLVHVPPHQESGGAANEHV